MARTPDGLITTPMLILLVIDLNGGVSFVEIARHLAVNESTVRKGIKRLESDGFLERKRTGRRNFYRINYRARLTPKSAATVEDLINLLRRTATVDSE